MGEAISAAALVLAASKSGGGGGTPSEYLKRAAVSGNTLTLTNKDNTTVTFTPTTDLSAYRTAANQDIIDAGKQATLTAGANITISGATISAASYDDTEVKADIAGLKDGTIYAGNATNAATATNYAEGGSISTALAGKQPTLTAGSNISITDNTISSTIPAATSSTLGGVKVTLNGTELSISTT